MRVFYGSIHDIGSFPCEVSPVVTFLKRLSDSAHMQGAKEEIIADASKSVSDVEGQWIENVHLRPYKVDQQFWDDYKPHYSRLFDKAAEFIHSTGGTATDDVIVLMRWASRRPVQSCHSQDFAAVVSTHPSMNLLR